MIGPSSSHSAGAARLGLVSRMLLGADPKSVRVTLYGSFAKTYRGHGTDRALVAGALGLHADDVRLRTLGGRRFVCYSAVVEAQDGAQTWFTYETWDAAHQVTFETRMSDAAVLPILATIDFDI